MILTKKPFVNVITCLQYLLFRHNMFMPISNPRHGMLEPRRCTDAFGRSSDVYCTTAPGEQISLLKLKQMRMQLLTIVRISRFKKMTTCTWALAASLLPSKLERSRSWTGRETKLSSKQDTGKHRHSSRGPKSANLRLRRSYCCNGSLRMGIKMKSSSQENLSANGTKDRISLQEFHCHLNHCQTFKMIHQC